MTHRGSRRSHTEPATEVTNLERAGHHDQPPRLHQHRPAVQRPYLPSMRRADDGPAGSGPEPVGMGVRHVRTQVSLASVLTGHPCSQCHPRRPLDLCALQRPTSLPAESNSLIQKRSNFALAVLCGLRQRSWGFYSVLKRRVLGGPGCPEYRAPRSPTAASGGAGCEFGVASVHDSVLVLGVGVGYCRGHPTQVRQVVFC